MRSCLLAGIVAMTCVAGRAEGQPLSVGLGAGSVVGLWTDDSASKRVFAGSVRYDIRRHVAVEAEVAHWSRERTSRSGPRPIIIVEPDGTETRGQLQSRVITSTNSTWATSVNFLAHSNGRVAVFGGGGLGWSATRSDYSVSFTGCSAPSRPEVCADFSIPRRTSAATLQAVTGAEVMITKRLGGFASVRASTGYLYQPAIVGAVAGVKFRF
jgi:hypothetical protein